MLGHSYFNEMTETSWAPDHELWKTNTTTLDLGKNTHKSVGRQIYTFVNGDKFGKFVLKKGNNNSAYLAANGRETYFSSIMVFTSIMIKRT